MREHRAELRGTRRDPLSKPAKIRAGTAVADHDQVTAGMARQPTLDHDRQAGVLGDQIASLPECGSSLENLISALASSSRSIA
jgi:hypothetical protein